MPIFLIWNTIKPFFNKYTFLVIALLATAAYFHWMRNTIVSLRLEVEQKEQDIVVLEASKQALQGAINTQNAALEAVAKQASDSQQAAQTFAGNMVELQKASQIKIGEILKVNKPVTCEAAIQYLIDRSKVITWQSTTK